MAGDGYDILDLNEAPAGFVFNSDNCANIEELTFHSYINSRVTIADSCDPVGSTLRLLVSSSDSFIDASGVTGTLVVTFAGRGEIQTGSGNDVIYGTYGDQTINGGIGSDNIYGGYDNDTLTGGAGPDVFHSDVKAGLGVPNGHDIITDFNVAEDKLEILSKHHLNYSRLAFEDDGSGGTVVVLSPNPSVDLQKPNGPAL